MLRHGGLEEERGGEERADLQASAATSEFNISSSEVDQALENQGTYTHSNLNTECAVESCIQSFVSFPGGGFVCCPFSTFQPAYCSLRRE